MKYQKYLPLFLALICVSCFILVWTPSIRYSSDPSENLGKNVAGTRGNCQTSVGSWLDAKESYDTAKKLELPAQSEVLPPQKDTPFPVNFNQFRRSRCILSLRNLVDLSLPVWLQVPAVEGDSAIYVNGILTDLVHRKGNVYGTLLPSTVTDGLLVEVISVRTSKTSPNVGITHKMPILVSNDFKILESLRKFDYSAASTLNYGRINLFIGLALIFLTVWISGLKYNDIAWMLITMASISIQATFVADPGDYTPELSWRIYQTVYLAALLSQCGYALAFLRAKEWESRFRILFFPILGAVTLVFYAGESYFSMPRSTFLPALSSASSLGFALFSREALQRAKITSDSRRANLKTFAIISILSAFAFAAQALGLAGTGNISLLIQPGVALVFATFLGIDLVLFHRRLTVEKDSRQVAETRNEILTEQMTLGQSVQKVLLPPFAVHESNSTRYTFSYQPKDHMAGDWATYWESDENFNVLAGKINAKGAPAAVAMAAVMGLLQDAKNSKMSLQETIMILNDSIRTLFKCQLLSAWTSLTVSPHGDLIISNGNSMGWLIWDGKTVYHRKVEGFPLGSDNFTTPKFEIISASDWKLAITASAGVCPDQNSVEDAMAITKKHLMENKGDAELISALFAMKTQSPSQQKESDDQAAIIVRHRDHVQRDLL